ncbi:MAG: acylphosphatase [Robiginitalea sp.]|nr:acylphosphatase [Robiginitalea sp.]
MKRKRLTITGKVQGVFYRKSAQARATALGLSGWVKNLENGGVMAEVQGEPFGMEQFIAWCKEGPESARVAGVEIEVVPSKAEKGFRILY